MPLSGANRLALRLDQDGLAEMSCIAGVGGGVVGPVRIGQGARPILAFDGCALRCVSGCLNCAGVQADIHVQLADHGVKKHKHADFDSAQAAAEYAAHAVSAARQLHAAMRHISTNARVDSPQPAHSDDTPSD